MMTVWVVCAAVKAWRDSANDFGRIQLVKQYFMAVDGEEAPQDFCRLRCPCKSLEGWLPAGFTAPDAYKEMPAKMQQTGFTAVLSRAKSLFQQVQQDPFYAVVSFKDFKPEQQ